MAENLDSNGGGAEKRRSTRVMHSASITIKGTDTLGQPFRESTKTVMVNCYGCQYQGIRYPAPNSSIMLEVSRGDHRRLPRVVPARVIWVRRPQAYRTLYHVGIEFEVPGNVWDIALPPGDWFPCPEDEELVIPVSSEENIARPNQFVLSASVADVKNSGRSSDEPANALVSSGVRHRDTIATGRAPGRSWSSEFRGQHGGRFGFYHGNGENVHRRSGGARDRADTRVYRRRIANRDSQGL